MSGLSTAGDVKLDGDPNAFTGTNTFDVNRPTSTLGGTPSTTDFITKQDGDTLYQGAGNVALLNGDNAFTGTTNTFDNRPAASSTPATTAGTLDFVIKRDTDLLYVTKDTDQDITGKKTLEDTLTLDGASNINIGQIDLKGSVGNTIHQFTGSFGNQILQGSNTAGAPSMPLGASLIYQAGTNDIIETEGKVVCPTAPAAGNDLTNKTYVDAAIAAGGGGAGDAVLSAGTNGAPQDFTGVNKFNKLLIGVNTSSQAFHNTSTTNLVGPIYASGTFQQNLNVNARIKAYSGLFSWAQQFGFTNSSDTAHPTMRLFRASEMMGSTAYSGYSSLMYGGTSSANRIYFRNALNQTPSTNNGNIVLYATSFVYTSDDRLKHNERYITDALKTLCKLRPQRYLKYGEGEDVEEAYEDSGLIAQEIWYDAPELRFIVRIPPDADPQPLDRPYDPQDDPDYEKFGWTEAMSYVDYMALSGYYIQAFKELDAKNKELEARLEALEKKI